MENKLDAVAVLALLKECSWLDADPCDNPELADAKEQALAVLAAAGPVDALDAVKAKALAYDMELNRKEVAPGGDDYAAILDMLGVRP